jgi:sugar phosphate permease
MSRAVSTLRHPRRIALGWRLLALVSVIVALNSSFFERGATIFLVPVQTSLGLSRARASLVFSLARSEGAMGGPLVGYLVDRFGAKKTMTVGAILAGIGFVIFGTASSFWTFAVAYMLFISFGATMAFQDATSAWVNTWFNRFRVRAMAIREVSGNLGSAIMIPVMVGLIAGYGWRTVAIMAAAAYLAIILPLTRLLKDSPESVGLLPDGVTSEEESTAQEAAAQRQSTAARRGGSYDSQVDFTVKEALGTSSFWFLLAGTTLRHVAKAGVEVHLIAIFQWRGLDVATAGLMFTVWVAMNIPAKLVLGYFAHRAPRRATLAVGVLLYVLAFMLLLNAREVWLIALAAAIGGTSEAVTPLNWGTLGDYFGRRYYATLRGVINLSYSWAWLVMPFAAGWWFDHHTNYTVPLVASSVAALLSAVAYALIRRPPLPARLTAVRRVIGS